LIRLNNENQEKNIISGIKKKQIEKLPTMKKIDSKNSIEQVQ